MNYKDILGANGKMLNIQKVKASQMYVISNAPVFSAVKVEIPFSNSNAVAAIKDFLELNKQCHYIAKPANTLELNDISALPIFMDRLEKIKDAVLNISATEVPAAEVPAADTTAQTPVVDDMAFKLDVLTRINNFFNDFRIDIAKSNRFINTLALTKNKKDALNYVAGYVDIVDHIDAEDIKAKLASEEFKEIVKDIQTIKPSKVINNRLEIYYGPAGCGKTTKVINDNPGAKVMICGPSMSDADLLYNVEFKEVNGAAVLVYNKSALLNAMENGDVVILDEINKLHFDTLGMLQTITDNKQFFDTEKFGRVEIKEGFKILGTMNLIVNGRVLPLPEPLADRCAKICKFELTLEELAKRCF